MMMFEEGRIRISTTDQYTCQSGGLAGIFYLKLYPTDSRRLVPGCGIQ